MSWEGREQVRVDVDKGKLDRVERRDRMQSRVDERGRMGETGKRLADAQ